MVLPGRRSRDSGKDLSGYRDRRKKKERDNTRDLQEEETYEDVMNRDLASHDSGFFTSGIGSALGARQETVEEKKNPTVRRKLVTENLSEEKSTHDYQNGKIASQHSELGKGFSGVGARKKEKVEKMEQKKKPITHRYDQNRDLSVRPGTSGVVDTPGDRPVNGLTSMATLTDHINTIIKSECLTVMKDVLTTALEKVEALESKATKRTIEYEQTLAETPKKKRELSPTSSVEAPIPVTTVQRPGSAVGRYPAVPCAETSNHHPVDGNMFVQTEKSVHVLHQYSSILPVENCVFFEPVHVPEGSRSVTSLTSSQWRQQWMTIDNDHHSVVSGVSSHWRQHRTTDDDNDSDNSGTKSPQSEKKSFFERQDLSNTDEEQPEDAGLEDLSCNLLECSINGRSPRKTCKGNKSSEMYEMSSVKINMSTRSYVGSPSDRRRLGHVVISPSRSQTPPNANQRLIISQPRLSLPATPPQTAYDAGARICRCPRCGSVWTSELELEEHYFEHLMGNRSCAVGGCGYTCSSRNELRRHIRAAHLRKHTCRRCGKAYLMASTLERHLRQCLPCRQCPLCPSACVDDSLCDHVASAHGAGEIACNQRPELRYYVCRECRFATTSRTVALDHCQRHILGEINLNITLCEICDLLFVTNDLHFLMHAVDDSFNRKSFQVVDFDWRVSLNARRQLESCLKKIQASKPIEASIDEENFNVKSNVEETHTETTDILAPQTKTKLECLEINNDDSLQEKNKNSDLNQNEFDVIDKRIETNLSLCRESIHKMQDLMQEIVNRMKEANKLKGPGQSEILVERPLDQQTTVEMSQSNGNVDNNQSLPSSATAEVHNQNSTLNEETPMVKTNVEESNVATNNIIAPPSEILINDNEARDDSAEENTSLQENNKQTFLGHTNELNKRATVSINQSPNTTKQEDVLESSTMKEPEQQTTVGAKSQDNDNLDNNNQSLPSSLTATAAVQNQNAALYEATPTAKTMLEELNTETTDIMAFPNEVNLEIQAILNDTEARDDSGEEISSLQKNNKHTSLNHSNEFIKSDSSKLGKNLDKVTNFTDNNLAQCGTNCNNQFSNVTQLDDVLEANTIKEPVEMSQSNDNVDNNKILLFSLATEAQNQNAALDEETSSATKCVLNVKTNDIIALSSKIHHDQEARIDSVEENTSLQQTYVNKNKKRNKPNLPKLEDNIDKMMNLMQKYLAQRGTVSNNQSLNTTQQEHVLEANTIKEPVQSETLVEIPLEQQTLDQMSQSNSNVDDNQSLPSSSTVQNQYVALNKEAIPSRSNFDQLNVETNYIIALSSEMQLKKQLIDIKEEASSYSDGQNTWLNLTKSRVNKRIDLMQENNNPLLQKARNKKKNPLQSEILVESPVAQQTTLKSSEFKDNMNNDQSSDVPSSSTAEVLHQKAALDEKTPTAGSKFEDSNVETTDIMSIPNELNLDSQVILNDKEACDDSVEENTSLQENNKHTSLYNTNKLNEPNSSQLRENQNLAHYGTDPKNQLSNTNQQEDVLEVNTMKYSELSETSVERPLEQQTTVDMSQLNVNLDYNNQSLTSSLEAEVQNQIPAFDEETPNARSNFEDSNVNTNYIMASSNETHLESQVMPNDKKTCDDSVEENISLQENNKQTFLDYTNEKNEPNLAQYGTDSKTQLSNTTQHQHILEANVMKDPEQSKTLVERPLKQQTTVEISQSNDNVDHNKSLPSSLAVEVQNLNIALNEGSSTAFTNFEEPRIETNQNTEKNGDFKTTTKEDVVNDQNLIMLYASNSVTIYQAYKNNNETSTIDSEGVEKPNSAGEPKFTASKLDGSDIVTENEQKYEANTNRTKEKKILIRYSQQKEEKNDEASINNNDSVKVALSSIDINITISGTKKISVTAEEANSKNVLDKATQTSVEKAMTSVSALEETNAKKSSSLNNKIIIKGNLDKSQGETRAKESTSSGSPKEETITNDVVSDKGEDQLIIELTKTLAITTEKTTPEKADPTGAEETKSLIGTETIAKAQDQIITPAELTVRSGSQTEATYTNGKTPSEENKTVASTTEEKYTKNVAIGKQPKDSAKPTKESFTNELVLGKTHGQTNAKETEHLVEETDTKQVLTEKPHFESAIEKTMSSASANNETYIKANLDETQDHQARAELTVISGSQTETTNANEQTSGEEIKTIAGTTEETNTKDVAIEKAKDLTSNAAKTTEETYTEEVVFGNTHGQTNAIETEHLVVTAEEIDTKQVLTEKPHVESATKKTMNSASTNNETNIKAKDETQDHQARAELTITSGSQKEATNANEQTSGEEIKTIAGTTEETNTKDVAIEKAKDLTSNAAKTTEETYTEEVVFGNTHGQTNAKETEHLLVTAEETDTKQVLTEKPHALKAALEDSQDHEARAELTVISGRQTEATNANDKTFGEKNKTVASTTEETNTKDVAIEKVKDLTSNANPKNSAKIIDKSYPEKAVYEIIEETYTELVFENIHGQINAKETENFVVTSEETDTRQVLTENSHDETTAKETKNATSTINENNIKETKASDLTLAEEITYPGSPAEESNSKEISNEVQYQTSTEKTDSEEVLEKDQESQNKTSKDKTNGLEKTTKETDVKNHAQNTQDLDTPEKSKQYVIGVTDDKDEPFSKTATTSKKEQQANRGTGRSNNNNENNIKETKGSDHTRAEETTSPGSPTEESNSKEISEEDQYQTNKETRKSSRSEKTDSEEVLEKGRESQNETTIDKTNSLEKTTKETVVREHSQKTQDLNTVEKSKQYEKCVTDDKDEPFSKTATTSKKGQQVNRGRGRVNNNKRNNKNTRKGN